MARAQTGHVVGTVEYMAEQASGRQVDQRVYLLEALISRRLEPDPEKRFQTTVELEADLNPLDDAGEPIPVKRVVGLKILDGVITVAAALVGGSI